MEVFFTAVALAMDSFALSIASGSLKKDISFLKAVEIALIFGFFQALMPLFGYVFGTFVGDFVFSLQKYIAFAILFGIGIKFILESKDIKEKSIDLGLIPLLFGGFITSIDAFGVGITFGLEHTNIKLSCITIGLVCIAFCLFGVWLGKKIGKVFEDKALIIGGVILMGIGYKIVLET